MGCRLQATVRILSIREYDDGFNMALSNMVLSKLNCHFVIVIFVLYGAYDLPYRSSVYDVNGNGVIGVLIRP